MKKLIKIFLFLPLLLAFKCGEEEDCFGKLSTYEKPNLITIDNLQTNYTIGDTLWISSNLEILQDFDGVNVDLLAFDDQIGYSFNFYKNSVYNPEIYLCVDNTTTTFQNGNLINYWGCNQVAYERVNNELKSKVGIKLLESGNYRMEFYNINSFKENGYNCHEQKIQINTTISNLNGNIINFVVN